MTNPLFSTYTQGENRVTSSILAIFERIGISVLTAIFQGIFEDTSYQLIEFTNQVRAGNDPSIPDARIKTGFDFLIETKIKPNTVDKNQLIKHIDNHFNNKKLDRKLILLTPDITEPKVLKELANRYSKYIYWTNFDRLIDIIDFIIDESDILLTEREHFLLDELKEFIIKENLLSDRYEDRVVVIPARTAIPLYKKLNIYKCQPNRTFKTSGYLAFYSKLEIFQYVPKIIATCENIDIKSININNIVIEKFGEEKRTKESDKILFTSFYDEKIVLGRLKQLKEEISKNPALITTESNKLFILTSIGDRETHDIGNPVVQDIKSEKGNIAAFVQNQRYLKKQSLVDVKNTSEVIKKENPGVP